jgi:hypothetical protein
MRSVSVALKFTGQQRIIASLAGQHARAVPDEAAEKFLLELCGSISNQPAGELWIWSKAVKRFDAEVFLDQLKSFWLALFNQGLVDNGWTKRPLIEVFSHGFDQTEDWVWRIETVDVLPMRLVVTQESLYEFNPVN